MADSKGDGKIDYLGNLVQLCSETVMAIHADAVSHFFPEMGRAPQYAFTKINVKKVQNFVLLLWWYNYCRSEATECIVFVRVISLCAR